MNALVFLQTGYLCITCSKITNVLKHYDITMHCITIQSTKKAQSGVGALRR
jgi:hypothetical protein